MTASNEEEYAMNDEIIGIGIIPQPSSESENFVPHGRFEIHVFPSMMEVFRNEFEPYGGFVSIDLYKEALIALLDEPEVSALARFEADTSILELRPSELRLVRIEPNDYDFWWGDSILSISSDSFARIPAWSPGLESQRPEFRISPQMQFVVMPHVISFASKDRVINFLAENGIETEVREVQLLIFDDPYARYMPSHFLWVDTDVGIFFVWIVHPRGPFSGGSIPEEYIYRLYTPEDFRANWRTLMDRETMNSNR